MRRQLHILWVAMTCVSMAVTGCAPVQPFFFNEDGDLSHYLGVATKIEYPDVEQCSLPDVENAQAPITLTNNRFEKTWDLPLEDAVRTALANSKVMRTIGGRLSAQGGTQPQVGEPDTQLLANQVSTGVPTIYDPAITESNPAFGVEGALSAFDAQLTSSVTYDKTDRPQNVAPGLGEQVFNRVRQQDLGTFNGGIQKRTMSGGLFSVTNNTVYDSNNSPTRDVPSDWTTVFQAGLRQPLLQGAGTQFNQIAGPYDPFQAGGTIGFDGVLLARINMDISLADFERGVRELVINTEEYYWELYFAYRSLEARRVGRDSALETWKKVHALNVIQAKGGEADKEAQAREQYFNFRAQVEQALADLYRVENRLRYEMGIAATDGRLIRPKDEPTTAPVAFNWQDVHCEALTRSVELRQQKWRIKQDELELLAAKNFLLPRLDLVANYRWVGVGDSLLNPNGTPLTTNTLQGFQGTDAFSTLMSGQFQESQVGVQGLINLGFRRELTTVRNQQLILARERARLQDQELALSHQVTESVRNLDTFYKISQTLFNRRVAAEVQVDATNEQYLAGAVTLDLLLDAQRRRADAESAYFRSITDYTRAITRLHYWKGSLLEYNGVFLAEGPWPQKAYFDAHRRARQRDASIYMDYGFTRPGVFSRGPYDQMAGEGGHQEGGEVFEGSVPDGEIMAPGTRMPTPATGEPLPLPEDAGSARSTGTPKGPRMTKSNRSKTSANNKVARNNSQRRTPTKAASGQQFDWGAKQAGHTEANNNASGAFDWGAGDSGSVQRTSAAMPVSDDQASGGRVGSASSTLQVKQAEWRSANSSDQMTSQSDRSSPGWKSVER